ncbi:MAG: tetratricopeptide repeat protein [Candidatus Nanoarchaeia archaeon]|jgi:tetratricopeptide (TPR) repeat protein
MTLEETLFEDIRAGKQVDVERALLIASGCDTEEGIADYQKKIQTLDNMFRDYREAGAVPSDALSVGKALLGFLWRNPENIDNENMFQLTSCLDAQFSKEASEIGNCTGLSSVYGVLGVRNNLNIVVIANSRHVMPRLLVDNDKIDIESRAPNGFYIPTSYFGGIYKGLKQKPLIFLVACAYLNRGYEKSNAKKFLEAKEDYDRTLVIAPDFAEAYNNRGFAKEKLEKFEEAIADYRIAIQIDPNCTYAYENRGIAKRRLGDIKGAEEDFAKFREALGVLFQ